MRRTLLLSFVCMPLFTTAALAQTPVNLNTWSAESYFSPSGGTWTVAADGSSVLQSVNGQPTLFVSDFNAQGQQLNGKIKVGSTSDDDFIGFALGYNPGDNSNTSADYLLVDWKRSTQNSGGIGLLGLAASRVTGTPNSNEFWQHANLAANPTGGVQELARGATLGSVGWAVNTEYEFGFVFLSNQLQVYVDNMLEISINGNFNDGRFAFYNFSQNNVTYSAFTQQVAPPPDPSIVPEPSSAALAALAFLALGGASVRRRHLA